MHDREAAVAVPTWTFLSNHAHVLLLIVRHRKITLREVAERIGITERAVQRIVADLEAAQYIERERAGRRNHYKVNTGIRMRHPVVAHQEVGALIELITPDPDEKPQNVRRSTGANGAGKNGRPRGAA